MKQRGDVRQIFNANWEPVCEFRLPVLPGVLRPRRILRIVALKAQICRRIHTIVNRTVRRLANLLHTSTHCFWRNRASALKNAKADAKNLSENAWSMVVG